MEDSAIREGFQKLRPGTEYDALYEAALCRERADWMVGINASRLFSCLYNQPLAVGRVMTPVLAMTVLQEAAIAAFVPEKFYTVSLTLADGGTASSKRFAQKADAELLLSKCRKEKRVTVQKMERKEKSESPPQLYDLTALQRDANRLLGFTAQQTLDYAQSLYEKRLITYPRTDSRFLTEDMAASLPGLVADTGGAFAVEKPFPIHVQQVINGSKVTDHHALLPTKSMAKADLAALPAGERNILRLIAAQLLCAVGEPYCYAETTLTTICAGEKFTAKGKVVLSEGWKAVERKMLGELLGKQKEPAVLPDVQEQSQCSVAGAELKEGQTSPPKHFTEDLLLHAMETASADRPFRFHVSGTQRTYSIMNLGIMPLTLAPKSAPDFRRECALTHSITFGKNAQPAPERCRSERVWDFPTSILQRKICICAHECTACHNNASFLSAICNFQIGEKSHGKDEG